MAAPRVIVYGGCGALGSALVRHFKAKEMWVLSIDGNSASVIDGDADASVLVDFSKSWVEQSEQVALGVSSAVGEDGVDGIFCVAGGWAGGNCAHADFIKNSDLMWKQSVWSSVIAATVASMHLKKGGLLTFTGAQPAQEGTPGMIGYGMAKAAVHQLTKSLSSEKSGMPEGTSVQTILPITLDTPMNRKFMSKADFTKWTPLEYVAELFTTWLSDSSKRPQNGTLSTLVTKDSKTELV